MFEAKFTTTVDGLTVHLTDQSSPPAGGVIAHTDIAWGDGHTAVIAHHGTGSHTYAAGGTYTIKDTVHDGRGDHTSASKTVTVTAPAPLPPPPPPPPPPGGGGTGGGDGGGSAGSSGNYRVVSQRHTIQQLATGQAVNVESVGFQTIPSNVYCEVLVPLTDWTNNNSAAYINPVATAIETIMAGQPVQSANFTQDVDVSTNLLADFEDFIVFYAPAGAHSAMTTTVRIAVSELAAGADGLPIQKIQAAHTNLQNTAGL